jgi:hypothetical protein
LIDRSVVNGSLPGQQIWKDGVSSFLFGTNDTQEWSDTNVETSPAIQKALKNAPSSSMLQITPAMVGWI